MKQPGAPDAPQPTASPPLVSVIMPAFNASAYVQQALESVLIQDYPAIELIVVDDGSSDDTVQLLQTYGSRIRLLEQANAGPAAARNRGLAVARGELIAFLDADDVWLPGKVTAQVDYLRQHPGVDVVFGGFLRWEEQPDGSFPAPQPQPLTPAQDAPLLAQPSGWIYADLLLDSVIHIITAMVRREVFAKAGHFDEALPMGEDYDFWLRASRTCQMDQLARTVAWYRIHAASITKRPVAESAEYRVLAKALQTWGSTGPDGRSVPSSILQQRLFGICFGHAYLHFWRGSPRHAQAAFAKALSHSFWRPRVWVYWVLAGMRRLVKAA